MAKKVRKARVKKVDLLDIESAEQLPKEQKFTKRPPKQVTPEVKKTSYNKESEEFMKRFGLIK